MVSNNEKKLLQDLLAIADKLDDAPTLDALYDLMKTMRDKNLLGFDTFYDIGEYVYEKSNDLKNGNGKHIDSWCWEARNQTLKWLDNPKKPEKK